MKVCEETLALPLRIIPPPSNRSRQYLATRELSLVPSSLQAPPPRGALRCRRLLAF